MKKSRLPFNFYHIIKSLSYFDDAEREAMPVLVEKTGWQDVKSFFLREQKKLIEQI
ncbi:MAG: hypothetical protein ACOY31_07625 [Bacillota bacterium]